MTIKNVELQTGDQMKSSRRPAHSEMAADLQHPAEHMEEDPLVAPTLAACDAKDQHEAEKVNVRVTVKVMAAKKRKVSSESAGSEKVGINQTEGENPGAPAETYDDADEFCADAAETSMCSEGNGRGTPEGRNAKSPALEKPDELEGNHSEVDEDPSQIDDVLKRQLKALTTGLNSDVVVHVGSETVYCHAFVLKLASTTFRATLGSKGKVLRLADVDPRHFRLILEILYSGKTTEPQDADTLLGMGRASQECKITAASNYCTNKLIEIIDSENVFHVLSYAYYYGDRRLMGSCLKIIRSDAGTVLRTKGFINHCTRHVMKMILKQNQLLGINELGLFQACKAWAHANTEKCESLKILMRYIKFGLFSAEEFATHVCPTGLLDDAHSLAILRSCVMKDVNLLPKGFSKNITPRGVAGAK